MSASDITALRLQLRKVGFHPIPVEGKKPPLEGWPEKFNVTEEEIRLWVKTWHFATGTGCLAKFTPGLDDDITIAEAADAIEALAREFFEEHGDIHVRFGLPPKRLIPLRTDEPFAKLSRVFTAPNGAEQKIEILGDGQQYVVDGTHPDTGRPYAWFGGELGTFKREDLPYVRREDMELFLDAATKLLVEQFGFILKSATNGGDGPHETGGEPQAPLDLIAAAMEVIPNNADWDLWNKVCMATWRATGGSVKGFALFDAWSAKSPKYNARTTAEKWAALFKSPPTQIGAGTIFYMADQASPTWRQEYEARKGSGRQGPSLALPLTYFNDLSDTPAQKPWVIKNVLARGELSSWIGPPGKGKSALFVEIAIHAAAPRDWRSYRVKQRTGVVIFAFERADLTKRRLVAHKRRNELRDLPIAVTGKIINLLDPACADIMLATIREAEQHMRCEVGLIIVDTFAKGIAAGNGDEDKARDQNKVHANLRRLFDLGCNVHIAGVGHTGKDESRGERGSNARLADVDLQVQLGGDVIKTVNVTKANDQPEGVLTMFKLEPFGFGLDVDGDPFQVAIVSADIISTGGQQGNKRQKPTDRQTLALRALAEVVLARGQDPPPSYQLPLGIKVVTLKDWEEELYRSNVLDRDSQHRASRFKELRDGLASRCLIGMRDIWVWSAARPV